MVPPLLHSTHLRTAPKLAVSQQRRRDFQRRQPGRLEYREHLGKAWGVVATDINNDGRMDLFVANDTVANFLYLNPGRPVRGSWTAGRCGIQR